MNLHCVIYYVVILGLTLDSNKHHVIFFEKLLVSHHLQIEYTIQIAAIAYVQNS